MNAKLELVQDNATYSDSDAGSMPVTWACDTFLNSSVTIHASSFEGGVVLEVWMVTPSGHYTKRFYCQSDMSFNWALPIQQSPTVSFVISGLNINDGMTFKLSVQQCLTLPWIGQRCKQWTNDFFIPTPLQAVSDTNPQPGPSDLSSDDISVMYQIMMHALGEENNTGKQ